MKTRPGQGGGVRAVKPCRCRPAQRHRDCAYCGLGWDDGRICGVCRAAGIDGKVIAGTAAVKCAAHKAVRS